MGGCQRNTPSGECGKPVVPGTEYCKSHTMAVSTNLAERVQYQFDSAALADRVEHFMSSQQLYSLRSAIAMNEVMLEKVMNDEGTVTEDGEFRGLTVAGKASKVAEITKVLALLKKQSLSMEKETKQLYTIEQLLYLLNQTVAFMSEALRGAEIEGYEEIVLDVCQKLSDKIIASKPAK